MEDSKKEKISEQKKFQRHIPFGAIVLIIFGVTWLLANFGVVWVWKIWLPVVVIMLGVYLLFTKQK